MFEKIVFKPKIEDLDHNLFADFAEDAAKKVARDPKDASKVNEKNKPTQIRKFYDELVMWDSKVSENDTDYKTNAPLIKMMCAKIAYAKGRGHVDDNFEKLFKHCMGQVESAEKLHQFKLFFEAFMGFYKLHSK